MVDQHFTPKPRHDAAWIMQAAVTLWPGQHCHGLAEHLGRKKSTVRGWLGGRRRPLRWLRSAGQVGGEDKLFPDSDYAASFRLDTVSGACPSDGVEPISL